MLLFEKYHSNEKLLYEAKLPRVFDVVQPQWYFWTCALWFKLEQNTINLENKINQAYVKSLSKPANVTHMITTGNKDKWILPRFLKPKEQTKTYLTWKSWHDCLFSAPELSFYTFPFLIVPRQWFTVK